MPAYSKHIFAEFAKKEIAQLFTKTPDDLQLLEAYDANDEFMSNRSRQLSNYRAVHENVLCPPVFLCFYQGNIAKYGTLSIALIGTIADEGYIPIGYNIGLETSAKTPSWFTIEKETRSETPNPITDLISVDKKFRDHIWVLKHSSTHSWKDKLRRERVIEFNIPILLEGLTHNNRTFIAISALPRVIKWTSQQDQASKTKIRFLSFRLPVTPLELLLRTRYYLNHLSWKGNTHAPKATLPLSQYFFTELHPART